MAEVKERNPVETAQRVVDAEEGATPDKVARAKIIARAAVSAWASEKNKKLFYPAVLEVLRMPRAEALLIAKAIDENFDLLEALGGNSNADG